MHPHAQEVREVPAGRKILIVDDEPDLAATCARLVRRMGHEPILALTGPDALRLIDSERPDLVLTDLHLPGVDGLGVLQHARSGSRPTPVILVTAYASGTSQRQAREAGAVAYLPKPFSLSALRAAVECALADSSPAASR
jgi:CheY-like chemotaxis protein